MLHRIARKEANYLSTGQTRNTRWSAGHESTHSDTDSIPALQTVITCHVDCEYVSFMATQMPYSNKFFRPMHNM